ncbi:MAG: MarR family transcriptional regulator [Pseudomonadota bacterium]
MLTYIGNHGPDGAPDEANADALIEMLFFAYRDFTRDADDILAGMGFGRAHHRVLHFIDRKQGLTVAELLTLLGITKQSLARVLKDLVESGHVRQSVANTDRRQRNLHLTRDGDALIAALRAPQSRRINAALAQCGLEHSVVEEFLDAMLDDESRTQRTGLDALGG